MFEAFGNPRKAVRRRLAMLLAGCVWSAGFQRAEAADTISGNITVIQADPVILQPGELFDLNGRTLTFTPRAGGGYTTSVGGLSFDSRLGTNLQEGDDDSILVTLPFRFPFFGSIQTAVYVNSNGHLTFNNYSFAYHFNGGNSGSLGPDLSTVFDNFAEFLPRIAALWEDWDPRTVGGVFVNSLPDRLIVTWNGLPLYNTTSPTATFQAVLFSNGVIQIHYQNVTTTPGGGYLVGISPGSVSAFFVTTVDFSQGAGSAVSSIADSEPLGQVFGSSAAPLVHISAVARRFYRLQTDQTDQLVMFANFSHAMGNAFAFELTLKSAVSGIGLGPADPDSPVPSFFGSPGTLQSFLNMNRLSLYPADPNSAFLRTNNTLSILGQESGHMWLAFPNFNRAGVCSSLLLGRDLAHWSFFHDTDASDMEGNKWRDNGNGTFTTIEATARFGALDQYMMGLRPASEVPSFLLIENPSGASQAAGSAPQVGVTVSGTRRNVTVNDIVACEGARSPARGFSGVNATTTWRQAFVLLIPAGATAPVDDLSKIDNFRSAWTSYFGTAVTGRGSVSTTNSIPAPPSGMTATSSCFGRQITAAWSDNSANELGFKLERRAGPGGPFTQIQTLSPNVTRYLDTAVSPSTVYTYRARAFNAAGDSPYSSEAAGSPAAFADEPLTAGTTPVRAVHIGELRQTVDAARACAGLGTAAWTDSIAGDVAIKAVHVQELRDNLRPARDRFGMPAVSYTDDPLTPGVLIKKVHVDELRQAVR